jgi:hypothetical protein
MARSTLKATQKSFFPEPSLPEQLRIFLWERHLAAMVSWLEATPTGN